MNKLRLASPAKINLFLNVLGQRDDGYHNIDTLFQQVSLCDTLVLTRIESEYSILKTETSAIPFGERNLCIKAFNLMKERFNIPQNVEIQLRKNIPLGSGMGGGSGNAAKVIEGTDRLFHLHLSKKIKSELCAQVGMDVAFFLEEGAARGTRRGEKVQPLPGPMKPFWVLIAKTDVSVSTADAYRWLEGRCRKRPLPLKKFRRALAAGDGRALGGLLYNSFEEPVFARRPELARLKESLLEFGADGALMTGSGAAVYAICPSREKAAAIQDKVRARFGKIYLKTCRTIPSPESKGP